MMMHHLRRHVTWVVSGALLVLFFSVYQTLLAPPPNFPSGKIISIARGTSAPAVAQQLGTVDIVAHPSVLRLVLRIFGHSGSVQAGAYRFDSPQNVLAIASRLSTGSYGLPPVRLTFPEGTTVREMAAQIADAMPEISNTEFLKEAQLYEGYLFPDTYLLPPSSDASSTVELMRTNFDTKIAPFEDQIHASGRSLSDIVIVASLVEKEARSIANKRIVAGIIYNRLKRGMPLQIDAVFGYIFSRDTYSPSYADLKIDSPYNTYTHTGLPPGPIDNPGVDSLDAAINPTPTSYFYYLTGNDGLMHYATTYAAHLVNEKKYLN